MVSFDLFILKYSLFSHRANYVKKKYFLYSNTVGLHLDDWIKHHTLD